MVAFGRPFYDEGLISRSTVLRGLWAQLIYMHLGASEQKLARIQQSLLVLTRGWSQARIREIVADTVQRVVEPITYAEALDLIDDHRHAGRRVYLISASPCEIVEPLARYLGWTAPSPARLASTARAATRARWRCTLRSIQGLADPRGGGPRRRRPFPLLRLLRLVHRSSHAGGGRPPGGRQSRSRPAQGGRDRGWPVLQFVRPSGYAGAPLSHPGGPRPRPRCRPRWQAPPSSPGGCGTGWYRPVHLRRRRRRAVSGSGGGSRAQPTRSLRTAKAVSPMRTARRRSFFMTHTVGVGRPPAGATTRTGYSAAAPWRCPGTWWAPRSKRVIVAIPRWRVRFPSTSAINMQVSRPVSHIRRPNGHGLVTAGPKSSSARAAAASSAPGRTWL